MDTKRLKRTDWRRAKPSKKRRSWWWNWTRNPKSISS